MIIFRLQILCCMCMHSYLMTCKIIDLARSQSQISNCHTLLRVPYLLGDGVSTLFGYVENVEHRCSEMGQGGDGLHLDGVPLLQRMIQDAWRIYHLPAEVPVVHVTDKQRLGGEGVGFHLNVCSGNLEMANKNRSNLFLKLGNLADLSLWAESSPLRWINIQV